jgi:glycosyltransferase involved in cell wall biosynthesis
MHVKPETRLKVLINALSARQGGGQTYMTRILEALPSEMPVQVFVLAPDSLKLPERDSNIHRLRVPWPTENPFTRAIWEKLFLPKLLLRLEVDVLFCPGGVIGCKVPRNCESLMTFQNMLPFDRVQRRRYPLGYMRVRNWLLKQVTLRSAIKADRIICNSQFGRRVIEAHAPGVVGKTAIIPNGVAAPFRETRCPRPDWLPRQNYILYVSILDVYKAQIEVVRGFSLLKTRRHTKEKLVLAGPHSPYYTSKVRNEIRRLGLEQDVLLPGAISYSQIPALYQNALINIFASECENCPNILLEALASGRPLLASNRSPMPELAGDAPLYFDPADPEDLAAQLYGVIDDQPRLQELAVKARLQSQLYDWGKSGRATWTVVSQLRDEALLAVSSGESFSPSQEQVLSR